MKKIICPECSQKVERCDMCDEEFVGQSPIICFKEGEHHFCDTDCCGDFFVTPSDVVETYCVVK